MGKEGNAFQKSFPANTPTIPSASFPPIFCGSLGISCSFHPTVSSAQVPTVRLDRWHTAVVAPCRRWDCQGQGLGWPPRQAPAAFWRGAWATPAHGLARGKAGKDGSLWGSYGVMGEWKKPWVAHLFLYLLSTEFPWFSPSSGQKFPFLVSSFLLFHVSLSVTHPVSLLVCSSLGRTLNQRW